MNAHEESQARKETLRRMLLAIHNGESPETIRPALVRHLKHIPYEEVVEVEQQLLREGLPVAELIAFCDVHSQVLNGVIEVEEPTAEAGHPAAVLRAENEALLKLVEDIRTALQRAAGDLSNPQQRGPILQSWQLLADVDKHYRRKENLLFPYLEQKGIDGPPKVMWGKHDEVRAAIKAGFAALMTADAAHPAIEKALVGVLDMIQKEEQIFLPLCQETLTTEQWATVHAESSAIGYCIIDPPSSYVGLTADPTADSAAPSTAAPAAIADDLVRFPSGALSVAQLTALLNTVPFDMTVVDANDRVAYFTQGKERIFDRTRAIIGRDVRMCHPPHSVDTVEKILSDFKAGRAESAPFWIQLKDRFIHIEYFALRDPAGAYLGCLEVSQDLTEKRALTGQQRLLQYR